MDKLLLREINPEFINNMDNKFLRNDSIFLFAEVVLDHTMQQISYKKMALIMFTMLLMGLKEKK